MVDSLNPASALVLANLGTLPQGKPG